MKPLTTSPETGASWLSRLTFWWMLPTLKEGARRPLSEDDLIHLHPGDQIDALAWFSDEISRRAGRGPVALALYAFASQRTTLVRVFLLSLLFLGGILGGPLAVREVVHTLGSGNLLHAAYAGALLIALTALTSLAAHHMFFQVIRLMVRLRSGFTLALYRKSLRLSPDARERYTTGGVINLVTTDLFRFIFAVNFSFSLWTHPIQIALSLWLLYMLLGPAGLLGAGALVLALIMTAIQARYTARSRRRFLQWSDRRLGLVGELLAGIRTIKAYGWEGQFARVIGEYRNREQKELWFLAGLRATGSLIYNATPILCGLVAFSLKLRADGVLDPGDVFAAVGLLASLRFAVVVFPENIAAWFEARESLRRLDAFLAAEENPHARDDSTPPGELYAENLSLRWPSGVTALRDITLTVRAGEHVIISGRVGSGKSTLLAVLAGERVPSEGEVRRGGEVAYVPQVPWILNDTFRNNILFGAPYNTERFERVLRACHLLADIDTMPAGIDTEIGEQGVNLSGGQRQRLALARAAYSAAPVVLLDDPLSALDTAVGSAISRDLLQGWFADRTVILATHRSEFLSHFDRHIHLEEGAVTADMTDSKDPTTTPHTESAPLAPSTGEGAFTEEEERFTGSLARESLTGYLSAYFTPTVAALFILAFTAFEGVKVGSDLFLAASTRRHLDPFTEFVIPYGVLAIALAVIAFGRSLLTNLRGVAVTTIFHSRLLDGIARAPVAFFERTPRGRVLNRFSRDVEQLDTAVTQNLFEVSATLFAILAQGALLVFVSPFALIPVVTAAVVFYWAQGLYRPASREAQRLDSITRSPILSQFAETLQGLAVIRSARAEGRFIARIIPRIELNARAYMTIAGCNRWVGVWVEMLGVAVVTGVVVIAVAFHGALGTPAIIALALTYALGMNNLMNWALRTLTMLESGLTSAERVLHYAAQTPERYEGDTPAGFPRRGAVTFTDLSVRYRPDLAPVLRNFSLSINGGERIGIVGRTGSGKSTLIQALLRIIEVQSGSISIDGFDTSSLELTTLRRAISYIPQEPVVFTGSVRFNLDPFGESDDAALFAAIRTVGLESTLPSLDEELAEGGANLSFGERQLLCLARTLIRRTPILVLDEATSGVDRATDEIMQRVIREHFSASTIIAIAHRRETLDGYDRVIEIDKNSSAGPRHR